MDPSRKPRAFPAIAIALGLLVIAVIASTAWFGDAGDPDERHEKELLARLEAGSPEERRSAAGELVKMGSSDILLPLLKIFARDEGIRPDFSSSPKMAVAGWYVHVLDDAAWKRFWPAGLLVRIGEPAVEGLIYVMQGGDKWIRFAALRALVEVGAPAVPLLVRELETRERLPAVRAAYALSQLGPDAGAAVPALTRALESDYDILRSMAAFCLGRIGKGAADAVPALKRNLEDMDGKVRWYSERALWKIEGRPPGPEKDRSSEPGDPPPDEVEKLLRRLEKRLLALDIRNHDVALRFLGFQFEQAKERDEAERGRHLEGEVFGSLFDAIDWFDVHLGEAWLIVLEELGCKLTAPSRKAVMQTVSRFLALNKDLEKAAEDDPALDLLEERSVRFRDFLLEMDAALGKENFALLATFFERLHLRFD